MIMLEGSARLSLKKYPSESVLVRGGQMEDVPAGATKLPPPVDIDVKGVMKKHPLIRDFAPLPSRDLIAREVASGAGRAASRGGAKAGREGARPPKPSMPEGHHHGPSGY